MEEVKLPEPFDYMTCLNGAATYPNNPIEEIPVFTAEQVRQAVLAERERCARICEELIAFNEWDPGEAPANHIRLGAEPGEWINDHRERAAAIRKGA